MNKTKLLTLLVCAISTQALGQSYYSIDVQNNFLVKIDANTGWVLQTGKLWTVDPQTADLAWHNGILYMLSYCSGSGYRLCQVYTGSGNTGYVIWDVPAGGGGWQGDKMSGLASDGASLYVTYSKSAFEGGPANSFGKIGYQNGGISFLTTLSNDSDGLCCCDNRFWSVDRLAPTTYQLFAGWVMPNIGIGGAGYDMTGASNPGDIEDYSATELLSISEDGTHLVRINKSNGARGVVKPILGLPAGARLQGLAKKTLSVSTQNPG